MVGQLSLSLAITAPVFMLATLSLRNLQATDTTSTFSFHDYLLLRSTMIGIACLAITAILFLTDYSRDVVLISALMTFAKAMESLGDICYGLMQRRERMEFIARSLILRGALSVAAVVALMAATGNVIVSVAGMAACWAGALLAYDVPKALHFLDRSERNDFFSGNWGDRWRRACRLGALALPLGLVLLLVSLNTNIPRYFIDAAMGEEALGYYSAIVYFSMIGVTVVNALCQAATPQLAQRYARQSTQSFLILWLKLMGVATLVGLGGWAVAELLGEAVLTVLYTESYAAHADLLAFLLGAATFSFLASVSGYGMTAMRKLRIQLPIAALATLTTVVFCALLVPRVGLAGAIWAFLAGSVVQFLAGVVVVASGLRALTGRHGEPR